MKEGEQVEEGDQVKEVWWLASPTTFSEKT